MSNDITPDAARAALDSASTSTARVHARARWMGAYLIAFGIGFGAITLVLGLVEPLALRMAIFTVTWVAFVTAMVVWARSRPASADGGTRRTVPFWIGTAVLYGAALFAGPELAGRDLAFWVPAAVVVALPLVVGGLLENRR